jgi:5'-3' exonuclease
MTDLEKHMDNWIVAVFYSSSDFLKALPLRRLALLITIWDYYL